MSFRVSERTLMRDGTTALCFGTLCTVEKSRVSERKFNICCFSPLNIGLTLQCRVRARRELQFSASHAFAQSCKLATSHSEKVTSLKVSLARWWVAFSSIFGYSSIYGYCSIYGYSSISIIKASPCEITEQNQSLPPDPYSHPCPIFMHLCLVLCPQ